MEVKLYVGNLSYATTEDDLRSLFAQAGTVKSVALIKDRDTGRSKGFAFVEMDTQAEAQKAGHAAQIGFAIAPTLLECFALAGLYREPVHRDVHGIRLDRPRLRLGVGTRHGSGRDMAQSFGLCLVNRKCPNSNTLRFAQGDIAVMLSAAKHLNSAEPTTNPGPSS